ncbi:MAG: hypothetical protein IJS84_08950 [Spirochaetales bacterium]|nr:hypothetical protein [Spirochaetales bacterium]
MENDKAKTKRKKLHEFTAADDIRYLGPISYREFRIVGWLCIIFAQVVILMNFAGKINADFALKIAGRRSVLTFVSNLSLPLLLFSNFAIILSNKNGYKKQLISYGGLVVGIFLLYVLFFHHFILGTYAGLIRNPAAAKESMTEIIRSATKGKGFFAFNIFIDLFLCTSVMYFLNHEPKRVFIGKKRIIFRLFAILPIAYEALSIYLKWLSTGNEIRLPFIIYPLLTVKPPMTFVTFIILALFVKKREKRFCRNGRSLEEYQEFLNTRRNSLNFSAFAAIILVVMGLIDLFITIIFPAIRFGIQNTAEIATASAEAIQIRLVSDLTRMMDIGFGDSVSLILLAPFMLLFSYNRTRKHPEYDFAIPIAAVVLIVLTYFQGIYQIVRILPISEAPQESTQSTETDSEEGPDLGQLLMLLMMMSPTEDMDFSSMDMEIPADNPETGQITQTE